MINGENPNWGRVLACVGSAQVRFDPQTLEILLQGHTVYCNQGPALADRDALAERMKEPEIAIAVRLHQGSHNHTMWASDLTQEYVKINAEYN